MNNYVVKWLSHDGLPNQEEAQYLSDLLQVVKELLGEGIEVISVCRLKKPE